MLTMDRRTFARTLAFGALGGCVAAQPPAAPLVPWMYMIYPLEQWLSDYPRTLDAWEEGGVRGLVIGPLVFFKEVPRFDFTYARPGAKFPVFAPDPAIYRKYGVDPPPEAPRDPQKEKQLQGLVANAAARGWDVLFFGPGHSGRSRSFKEDPFGALSLAAGIEDTMRAGGGLCHRDIVEMVVREAPAQINDLIQWGTHFDEEDDLAMWTRTLLTGAAALAALVVAVAVKSSSVVLLPFALLGSRRPLKAIVWGVLPAAVIGVVTLLVFGTHISSLLHVLQHDARLETPNDIPGVINDVLGLGIATHTLGRIGMLVLLPTIALLLVRVYRGGDWLENAGWATCAVLVTTTWFLPWYLIWFLPLAALALRPYQRFTALALSALAIGLQLPLIFGH